MTTEDRRRVPAMPRFGGARSCLLHLTPGYMGLFVSNSDPVPPALGLGVRLRCRFHLRAARFGGRVGGCRMPALPVCAILGAALDDRVAVRALLEAGSTLIARERGGREALLQFRHGRCGVRVDFSKSAIKDHSDPISHFLGFHGHSVRMSVEAAINAHPAPNNPARKLNQKTDLSETFVGSFIGHSS